MVNTWVRRRLCCASSGEPSRRLPISAVALPPTALNGRLNFKLDTEVSKPRNVAALPSAPTRWIRNRRRQKFRPLAIDPGKASLPQADVIRMSIIRYNRRFHQSARQPDSTLCTLFWGDGTLVQEGVCLGERYCTAGHLSCPSRERFRLNLHRPYS